MPRSPRVVALVALVLGAVVALVVAAPSGSVHAHNSLLASDPADHATLAVAPTQMVWDFQNTVPLETLTVTLTDQSGVRTEVPGSVHGPAGETQVITPLPMLEAGAVSLRWRLVGSDGHPITGSVDFTIAPPAPATTAPAGASAGISPTTLPRPAPPTSAPETLAGPSGDRDDTGFSTPSVVRWLFRYGSYLAIMAVVGILAVSATVWQGAGTNPKLRGIVGRGLGVVAGLAFVQLLMIASDLRGTAPWASFGSIDAATTTDAGMALALRILLAGALWLVLFRYRIAYRDLYWTAVTIPALGLLATWAFAGHSRSMRWPAVGVVTDVAHHAAAAVWIAGLAIVGWIVIPGADRDQVVPAVRRFSRVAGYAVAALVATGVLQSLRLVGSPLDLFDVDHGRYLAVKLVALAAMLAVANGNRRRVNRNVDGHETGGQQLVTLRHAMVAEFVIGLVVIGITAAMVVSPPASSDADAAPTMAPQVVYYTM